MVIVTCAIIAIALYLGAAACRGLRSHEPAERRLPLALGALALVFHGVAAAAMVFAGGGINFSLWPMAVLTLFAVNLIVMASGLRKPLHSLFVILFPAAALVLALATALNASPASGNAVSPSIGVHVIFALLAFSLFTIAAGQALLLAYQDHQLKNHHPGGFLRGLPPLQTMEALLFEVLWAGFILLSLALITGIVFIEDFWGQHLAHKAFFSLLGWLVFAVLLAGRHRLGWRGHTAIRWTLGGFVTLLLAYWGSKFVLEVILA